MLCLLLASFLVPGPYSATLQDETKEPLVRFVRIELPGKKRTLSLAEVQVMRNGHNVALAGVASQHSDHGGAAALRAIDGNTDGNYNAGSVTHTLEVKNPWWELDLGTPQPIDSITIFNRTDCCQERLEDFTLELLDVDRQAVWSAEKNQAPRPRADYSPWGRSARVPAVAPEKRKELQQGINRAIDRGVAYLQDHQLRDGSWGDHEGFGSGMTALCLYTMVKSGAPRSDPAVKRSLTYLLEHPSHKTYSIGCTLLALGAIGDPEHVQVMRERLDVMLEGQDAQDSIGKRDGMFAYPESIADLSCSQYAALGMYACDKAGIKVPKKAWLDLLQGTFPYQKEPQTITRLGEELQIAGFGYRVQDPPTGSMTTAGLAILAICEKGLGKLPNKRLENRVEESRRLALDWLGQNFSVRANPNKADRHYYYLYGLERVGALLARDTIGGHDWYWEGAEFLVGAQGGEGQWNNVTETCFALLFLAKATASSTGPSLEGRGNIWTAEGTNDDVRFRGTGDGALTFWVTGFSEAVLDRYTRGESEGGIVDGLRVVRVEYLMNGEVVETVRGDDSRGWAGDRFAIRHQFTTRGKHKAQVRVVVIDPVPTEGSDGTATLLSPELEVQVRSLDEPFLEEYASQGKLNLLRGAEKTVTASSFNVDNQKPEKALDGQHGSSWVSKNDDPNPTLTIELDKPVRANKLLLSHIAARNADLTKFDRATRVEIGLNSQRKPMVVELTSNELEKSVVDFPITKIKRIEIRIVERVAGSAWKGQVGFSEVELVFER